MSDPSADAVDLTHDADLIDLHVDTFIPVRLFGYDVSRRHVNGGRFFGHLDLPRIEEGGLSGAMWSITTNPFRTLTGRARALERNLVRLRALIEDTDGLGLASTVRGYRAARARGEHVCFLAIQGGNALRPADSDAPMPDPDLIRVTLVHLTPSLYGGTSTPIPFVRKTGLTRAGRLLVRRLDRHRVFVDLAHIHPEAFWQAVEAHDVSRPLLVTHTGVKAVRDVWRNLDDDQLRAIAKSGGVVGIFLANNFLARRGGSTGVALFMEHLEHALEVAGEEHVGIGTDYDGAITPPAGLRSGDAYPLMVHAMLERGWTEQRIRRVLGQNFLRALTQLRP